MCCGVGKYLYRMNLDCKKGVRDVGKLIDIPCYTAILRKFGEKVFFLVDKIPFINYLL